MRRLRVKTPLLSLLIFSVFSLGYSLAGPIHEFQHRIQRSGHHAISVNTLDCPICQAVHSNVSLSVATASIQVHQVVVVQIVTENLNSPEPKYEGPVVARGPPRSV